MSTPRTDTEVLAVTSDILAREGAWCKNAFFRDEDENGTDMSHAHSYCLEGALMTAQQQYLAVTKEDEIAFSHQMNRLRSRLLGIANRESINDDPADKPSVEGWTNIPHFNDAKSTTKEQAQLLVKLGLHEIQEEEDVDKTDEDVVAEIDELVSMDA